MRGEWATDEDRRTRGHPDGPSVSSRTIRGRGRRILIGDEMGLGKTITALATVAAEHAFPVVVACKPDLTENWRTEITRALPTTRVAVASGLTPVPCRPGQTWWSSAMQP